VARLILLLSLRTALFLSAVDTATPDVSRKISIRMSGEASTQALSSQGVHRHALPVLRPLRLAHIIAGGVERGASRGRP
jgi:hypothetical protein